MTRTSDDPRLELLQGTLDMLILRTLRWGPQHGHGIGQELLRQVEARCRELGVAALELNASYNAEAFYRRCGYEARGPVVQPLTALVTMGAIRMVRRLTSDTALRLDAKLEPFETSRDLDLDAR
mgnify:CR=1 FL=1